MIQGFVTVIFLDHPKLGPSGSVRLGRRVVCSMRFFALNCCDSVACDKCLEFDRKHGNCTSVMSVRGALLPPIQPAPASLLRIEFGYQDIHPLLTPRRAGTGLRFSFASADPSAWFQSVAPPCPAVQCHYGYQDGMTRGTDALAHNEPHLILPRETLSLGGDWVNGCFNLAHPNDDLPNAMPS